MSDDLDKLIEFQGPEFKADLQHRLKARSVGVRQLDHIAFRVADRKVAAMLLSDLFGYNEAATFQPFDDDSVRCIAMKPPKMIFAIDEKMPEIFISDGKPDSIVGKWVSKHGGGIHHIAYRVSNVRKLMDYYLKNKLVEFLTDEPLTCPGIEQVFTKELPQLGGIIIEFISRGDEVGFCQDNVKALMESTVNEPH